MAAVAVVQTNITIRSGVERDLVETLVCPLCVCVRANTREMRRFTQGHRRNIGVLYLQRFLA